MTFSHWPADLGRRETNARERMDDPAADPETLSRTYDQFRYINGIIAGWRRVYRRRIRPLLKADGSSTLLDIGSGGGDVTRALARWAAQDGLPAQITGIDPDDRAHAHAAGGPALPGLTFRRAFSSDLVAEGHRYDVVVSNHMLHHLTPDELQGLLADSRQLCSARTIHADIERSRLAYALFAAGTWPFFSAESRRFFRTSFIREDGLISIRRSYTASELAAVAPDGWRVEHQRPYRNLLIYDVSSGSGGPEGVGRPAPSAPAA